MTRFPGRPSVDVATIALALVFIFPALTLVVPGWVTAIPAVAAICFVFALIGSHLRSGKSGDGWSLPLPVWILVSMPIFWLVSLLVAATGSLSPASVALGAVIAVAGVHLIGALGSADLRQWLAARRDVTGWLLGYLALCSTVVFGVAYFTTASPFRLGVFAGFVVLAIYLWLVVPLATIEHCRRRSLPDPEPPYPTVSVIVPAYNEEGYVGECIESILDTTYPTDRLEVVVVDDGSEDGTFQEATQHRSETVSVYHKDNGGKYSALNFGLLCSSGDIVVCVDADSRLLPDSLSSVVAEFQADPDVGAIAGNVKVENRSGLLTRLQAIEYLVGINTYRRAFSWFGAVPIVPGCLSGFRREALEGASGYDPDTVTEDFDLTVKVLKCGWTVRQSEAAVLTEAPFTLRDLYRQRRRWFTGAVETLLKHRGVLFDGTTGNLHRFSFPFYVLRVFLTPVIAVLMYVGVALAVLARPYETLLLTVLPLLGIASLYALLVIRMEDESLWLLPYVVVYVVGFKQFLEGTLVVSLVRAFVSEDYEWGDVRRAAQLDEFATDGD
ncbi:hypothetical protein BV210_03650 [Halorientalis sp. IM1011]|uniref:glycosyltransferase family 2 protein n=1 Tax=Halorientalis sp. IM1011 TaxID=1932360 RepID=UPI00097CCE9A|nr:glycosyltransferase family 2 protein [Halorientalis sp. IM1011]AQL41865.1 hypothetical protein BV210_03650 [Halorientalis sp. IM1011]